MSLTQALNTSLSGLRATQTGMALVAGNVANAQTPGYVRRTLNLQTAIGSQTGGGVLVGAVNRELDQFVQRQLRVEMSGGGFAELRAQMYQRLQGLYGAPGSDSALETVFNNFTTALQTLSTSPESGAARSAVMSTAQVLTQHLNSLTDDIQALRQDAESGLAESVASANAAMQKISDLNTQLAQSTGISAANAALEDQRDSYVDQLADLIDIRIVKGEHNEYNIFTNSGIQLVGSSAAQFSFNAQGTITPATLWDPDPTKSTVGTLNLIQANGGTFDLIANNGIRSGRIAAFIDMRDHVLVQAQAQLDGIAAAMSKALSDDQVNGSTATSGAQAGFDLVTTGLQAGDSMHLTYTDGTGEHTVTIIRVDDSSVLPLSNLQTPDPNDRVIGVDFSNGLASVAADLNTYFNNKITFSASGATLRVLDDGNANTTAIDSFSLRRTASSLTGGISLPFFTDGANLYSGVIDATGEQSIGFAGRIGVNPLLLGDPSKLVLYNSTIATGDPARPNFIYDRMTGTPYTFSPDTGIGIATAPFSGDLTSFLRQMLSQQGDAAANAQSLSEGQTVVVNALRTRFADQAAVNIDQEMAHLISLQTAYGASARIMSAVRDMIDQLLKL